MRDGDLDTFFTHENQSTPSLSLGGKIRLGTKEDLLQCLELEEIQETNAPVVNAKFFDVVQMLRPGTAKTFQDYADAVFSSYMSSHILNLGQIDSCHVVCATKFKLPLLLQGTVPRLI